MKPAKKSESPGKPPPTDEPKEQSREELLEKCSELAADPNILGRVERDARETGFAGATALVLLVYLAVVTRLFARPVSVALAGPSSAGKSFTTQTALRFHPPEAAFVITGMSEKALLYMDEPLEHRMLVVHELAGVSGDFVSYGLRTLLSEGRLDYHYTDFEHRTTRHVRKQGPTGLLTSTAGSIDRELGTRVITPSVADDKELTRAIMLAAAEEYHGEIDYEPYHALQRFLAAGDVDVTVPFGRRLAEETDATAVRMRRDFSAVLGLTRAHALLQRQSRESDGDGRVVATIDDYAAVHGLVAEMVAEAAEKTVPDVVRETVQAVSKLHFRPGASNEPVTIAALAKHLGLNRTSVTRRVNRALGMGYLKNQEVGRSRPKLLVPGDPLPEDREVLPPPELLS